ncbi:MAG TPA: amino acid adenylation domain-containing protein, partial [Caldithrix abyssi]|nr:amino acid adenylation domain-containing protein [Caldithrix abyssi]
VPIDPNYPEERIQYILKDSKIKILLTQQSLTDRFSGSSAETIALDDPAHPVYRESKDNLSVSIDPEQLVYLIYTSGTTGQPKAVMVRHGSLLNHALAMREEYDLQPDDRMLQYISISFDASAEEIYPTLISGAALVLPQNAAEMTGNDLLDIIRTHSVSALHLPVPMWHYFVDFLHEQGEPLPDSVRLILVGGEAPSVQKFKLAAQKAHRPVTFMNLYGPTETTITALAFKMPLKEDVHFPHNQIPIGKPLTNVRTYILDSQLQPVPSGVVGEIYIGGIGVARGYLNRPELTAERFMPDPFSDQPGARLYRTGDLGRFTEDGNILFAGRSDFQVKIRGLRIELGEIEAALEKHPQVKEAIVLAKQYEGTPRLVAYLIPQKEANLTIAELRGFLGQHLPDYMIPAYFVALESFPLTATGKIDRKRLPEPHFTREELADQYEAPRNEKERILADIWQELLKMPKVGVKDNFFELGGDSILSIQVIARANQKGLKITPKQLFEYPTIEGLAAVAEEGVAIQAEQGVVSGEFPLIPI